MLEYIQSSPGRVGKRELARAFRLNAEQKVELRELLRGLEDDGSLSRGHGRQFRRSGRLPTVAVLEILDVDVDGEMTARPATWTEEAPPPRIYVVPDRRSRAALVRGDRVLARLAEAPRRGYEARVIRRLHAGPVRTLGIFELVGGRGRLLPVDRRAKEEVRGHRRHGAEPGELVSVEVDQGKPLGLRRARVVERCGPARGPLAIA